MNTILEFEARSTPADPERRVADIALRGQLDGDWQWLTPVTRAVARGRLSLRRRPDLQSAQVTEALLGERVEVLEDLGNGWGWVRTVHDAYLGYARLDGLEDVRTGSRVEVTVPRGHLFAAPKVSAPILDELALGARLTRLDDEAYDDHGRTWFRVGYGSGEAYVQSALVAGDPATLSRDLVFVRRFLDVPYVWGGRSAWGLDCSGLTQIWYGRGALPRDADQQQDFLSPVERPEPGDLAFFPGHVGIMLSEREMLHANATHMRVTIEVLGEGDYGTRLQSSLTGFGRWDGTPYRTGDL